MLLLKDFQLLAQNPLGVKSILTKRHVNLQIIERFSNILGE